MQTMTLIESRTNLHGIEVRHERTAHGSRKLRAYRAGELAAEQRFLDSGDARDVEVRGEHPPEVRVALDAAFFEARRLLRDGRGLE